MAMGKLQAGVFQPDPLGRLYRTILRQRHPMVFSYLVSNLSRSVSGVGFYKIGLSRVRTVSCCLRRTSFIRISF